MSTEETTEDAAPETPANSHLSGRRFADFPLSAEILKGVLDYGFEFATPVQAQTLEPGLAGKDLLVRAKTGTGKTVAFGIPVIERCDDNAGYPQVIILAPVRELAQQIAEELAAIAIHRDLKFAVLVGGVAIGPQEKALESGAEIIVGTPGRLLDHIRRGNLDLSKTLAACLDEADEMFSMGFYQDVCKILDACKEDRQILLFSATMDRETQKLIQRYTTDAEEIYLSTDGDHVEGIEHILYETSPSFHKARALLYLLDMEDPDNAIIFCNTREDTATVASYLDRQGLDVQLLSGELPQGQRTKVMAKVKAGEVRFLVATDVAARGIDISNLTHVINYSLPQDPSVYMHRIGRTGRIGNKGIAISLAGGPDLATRNTLQKQHEIKFEIRELPSEEVAVRNRVERQAKQIRAAMGTMVFEAYLPTVRELKTMKGGDALLAAALRAFFQWDRERRAVAGGVDSLSAISNKRRDDRERKAERNDRGGRSGGRSAERDSRRGRDSDGDSGRGRKRSDRSERSERKPRKEVQIADSDLDALLSEGAPSSSPTPAEDSAKPKRRRRRKKKSESSEAGTPPASLGDDMDFDSLLSAD
ncbi:MAG: ATP-dependent RNA helicase DeaD [Myxococcota bacterium]|jgi:ATP-dependent RNA helicase DeaD